MKRLWHVVPAGAVEISISKRDNSKVGRFAKSLFKGHGLISPHRINAERRNNHSL
jgi:hypothetical protein